MDLLLVSATFFEIRPLLVHLPIVAKHDDQLSTYNLGNMVIDLLIPGVGMVPTAYFLGRQLSHKHYDLAINAGIAGTFDKSLPIGSVVNIVEDCVPELGAEDGEKFLSVFDLGLTDPQAYPYKNGRLINDFFESGALKNHEIINGLKKVKGITSNSVRGNVQSIARIQKIAEAEIESMEGAAFFFGCFTEKVPCLQIRSVSNLIEERDKSRWDLGLALKNLNSVLWQIVSSISGTS